MKRFDSNEKIFRRGSVTYYYSSLFFAGQVKEDVFCLYAYVRVVDDLVDVPTPNHEELERIWSQTVEAWSGTHTGRGLVDGFVTMAKRRGFEWGWIESFWEAMRQDFHKKEYLRFEEVEEYMYGSAEVIGLMMARILGLSEVAYRGARLQGKATQWVNFIRDIAEDLSLGRVYMPKRELEKYNVDLRRPTKSSFDEFMRGQIKKYREFQTLARKSYKFLPKKYLVPIKTAAEMYDWTAEMIEKEPMIVWRRKVKPPAWMVLGRVFINAMFAR